MRDFKSGRFNFGRSSIGRALVISLALHAMLLLQTLPAAPNPWARVAPAGNSLAATLRGTPPPLAAMTAPTRQRGQAPMASRPSESSMPNVSSAIAKPAETGAADQHLFTGVETLGSASIYAVAAPPGEDGLDANGLRQYRLSLAVESRRFKRYPRQALEQGWSGTARVRIAMAASGVPESVQLLSSSGHAALDAVALDMISKAALNTVVPASLRGQAFSVPLPVEFSTDPEER